MLSPRHSRVGPFAWPPPTGDKAFFSSRGFSTSSDSDVDVSAESLGLLLYIAQSNGTKWNLEWVIEVKDFNLAGYDEKLSPGLCFQVD